MTDSTPPAPSAALFCPICSDAAERVFRTDRLPAETHRLRRDPLDARAARRAPIDLARCASCDHGFNAAFDPALVAYDATYHNPLQHSLTFQHYARTLAVRLATHARWPESRTKIIANQIVELGCGDGWFAHHLARATGARVVGLDPRISKPDESGSVRLAPMTELAEASRDASLLVARHSPLTVERYP